MMVLDRVNEAFQQVWSATTTAAIAQAMRNWICYMLAANVDPKHFPEARAYARQAAFVERLESVEAAHEYLKIQGWGR